MLIVHGNHNMQDFSDPGYAYLGELLASRGFILVSVDENFFNGATTDLLSGPEGGLKEENDARGWLLLEHLKVWREWNAEEGNPFYRHVDLDRIALIGHSRGGEAVAVAAAFNSLPFYPDDAGVAFDFGFKIRSVVAIAPVDGQYRPGGQPTPLANVNYLALQGSHDADLRSFQGARQYERVSLQGSRDRFKAALYIVSANHGQFNTVWGRKDVAEPFARFLNLRQIMPPEQQRQIAQVFISAFLESTLHGIEGYRPLFYDARAADAWLPDVVMIQQYENAGDQIAAGFTEDLDLTTISLPGGRASGHRLVTWREEEIQVQRGTENTIGVVLGWADPEASYRIDLPPDRLQLDKDSQLIFALADTGYRPGRRDAPQGGPEPPIDLTIEVRDREGDPARLPLSHTAPLQPRLEIELLKAAFMDPYAGTQLVFRSYAFPLDGFSVQNPDFDPARLASVALRFDRTSQGQIILRSLGFR